MYHQNKSYELTTDQLKKFEGFENITVEEAKEIIFSLKELSRILFGMFTKTIENRERAICKLFSKRWNKKSLQIEKNSREEARKKITH